MADNKINLPSSGGGLINYFNEFKSKVQIKPMYIMVVIAIFVVVEIYLYKTGLK